MEILKNNNRRREFFIPKNNHFTKLATENVRKMQMLLEFSQLGFEAHVIFGLKPPGVRKNLREFYSAAT
jgi:hypothetical protein